MGRLSGVACCFSSFADIRGRIIGSTSSTSVMEWGYLLALAQVGAL
jgi:hypothetical protein